MKDVIFLRHQERYERVRFEDILWAEAQSNYVKVVTEQRIFLLSITLQKLEEQLTPEYFVRVHRSYLVNVQNVNTIEGNLLYIGEKSIPVSKNKKLEVFEHFKLI